MLEASAAEGVTIKHCKIDGIAVNDHLDGQECIMQQVSVADAKSHFSELIDRVEKGGSIDITRRGKPVARLASLPTPRKPIDVASLHALTAGMSRQAQSAADLVREMRDTDRA